MEGAVMSWPWMAEWIKMKRIMVKFVIHLLTNYAITSPKIAEAWLQLYDNFEIHISFTVSFESKSGITQIYNTLYA